MINEACTPESGVSVVVPVRDRRSTIERAVKSALDQSPPVREVIVVDDGSTDGTGDLLSRLGAVDARVVRLRNTGRRGAQGARNIGIRAATGDWIAFLDSDDYWLQGSLNTRLGATRRTHAEVVHSNCLVKRAWRPTVKSELPGLRGGVLKDVLRAPGPVFPSLLVTRRALDSIGLLDEDIVAYQEWDTAIRLARSFEFAFCDEPTFVYDCSSDGTISADLRRGPAGYAQVVTKHREEILAVLGREALDHHYVVQVGMFSAARDLPNVLRILAKLACSSTGRTQLPAVAFSAARPWMRTVRASVRRAL